MREIHVDTIRERIAELCIEATHVLPEDVQVVDVAVLGEVAQLTEWVSMRPGWKVLEQGREGARLELASAATEELAAQLKQMVSDGLPVIGFNRVERKLEDAFVDMVRNLEDAKK